MVHKPVPPGQEFRLHNGRQVNSIKELSEYLKEESKVDYEKHVTNDRNDFANWIRHVHKKEALARALENSSTKKEAVSILADAVKKAKPSKRKKPIKAPVKPEQTTEERQIVKKVAEELDSQIRKTEAHIDNQEFVTKEFVFGFLFGLILGILATGIVNSLG